MKRIAILTAGGDTPALNATIHGAVTRANQLRVEVLGLMRGFSSLLDPRVPHVHLNPLFCPIPELDPTVGGTLLGSSRTYVDGGDTARIAQAAHSLAKLGAEGLVCIGGDGTLNGLQPLCKYLPTVLAPKTIDNDLGLNYPHEADHWVREPDADGNGYRYRQASLAASFDPEQMVNYVTPGYATAVFVSVGGVRRVRTTAESHRRIAIVEVMGRHSGYLALGSAYGQPDMILLPEESVHLERLVARVKEVYRLQGNVVIVCGEGIVDEDGQDLGAAERSTDPAGNLILSGAAERLRQMLIEAIGNDFFQVAGEHNAASTAIFTRKIGHTQRGGSPIAFDRSCATQLGGKAVDMLLQGQHDAVATMQWTRQQGFFVADAPGSMFRDAWGLIHARKVHPSMYDADRMMPSAAGVQYLLPIFTNAIGSEDVERIRQTLFDSGNLFCRYHSVNTDVNKRVRMLE